MKKFLVSFFVAVMVCFCFLVNASAEMGTISAKFDLFNNSKPNTKGISDDQLFADYSLPAFLLDKAKIIMISLYTMDENGFYTVVYGGGWEVSLTNGEGEFSENVVPQSYKMTANMVNFKYPNSFHAETVFNVVSNETTKVNLNFKRYDKLVFPVEFVAPVGNYIEDKNYLFEHMDDTFFSSLANYRDGRFYLFLGINYPYYATDTINFSLIDENGTKYYFTAPFDKWAILEDEDFIELDVEQVLGSVEVETEFEFLQMFEGKVIKAGNDPVIHYIKNGERFYIGEEFTQYAKAVVESRQLPETINVSFGFLKMFPLGENLGLSPIKSRILKVEDAYYLVERGNKAHQFSVDTLLSLYSDVEMPQLIENVVEMEKYLFDGIYTVEELKDSPAPHFEGALVKGSESITYALLDGHKCPVSSDALNFSGYFGYPLEVPQTYLKKFPTGPRIEWPLRSIGDCSNSLQNLFDPTQQAKIIINPAPYIRWADDTPSGTSTGMVEQVIEKIEISNVSNSNREITINKIIPETNIKYPTERGQREMRIYKERVSSANLMWVFSRDFGADTTELTEFYSTVAIPHGSSATFIVTMDTRLMATTNELTVNIADILWTDGIGGYREGMRGLPLTQKTLTY